MNVWMIILIKGLILLSVQNVKNVISMEMIVLPNVPLILLKIMMS